METKPGYKTTEFWTMIFSNFVGLLNTTGAWDFVSNRYMVIGLAIVNGLYAASRGIAKQGVKPTP